MPTTSSLTLSADLVKGPLLAAASDLIDRVLTAAAAGRSARELELSVASVMCELGREVLEGALATACRQATLKDLEQRSLPPEKVTIRGDEDYWMSLTSTFGPVRFPLFAYRDYSSPIASVTRTPAHAMFPLHPRCRSTELCLEWECRLAGQQPFRKAAEMLHYFTRGACRVEDTTIERHAVRTGHLIEQQWLYRKWSDVAEILRVRATRDLMTGRPIMYWSSDAHALRRYFNESWTAEWKMMNGMRLWCVDRDTGGTIHIGGEFTCGDADYLRERLSDLFAKGIMPKDGDFGGGVAATYVFVADGMPWFEDHLLPQLPTAVAILDVYHLVKRLAEYAKPKGKTKAFAVKWFHQALKILLGPPPKRPEPSSARKGHTKHRGPRPRPPQVPMQPHGPRRKTTAEKLLAHLRGIDQQLKGHEDLDEYITKNMYRSDYASYRARGFQIGSGAMESFHRTGSQERLKRAGARWLPETLEAMFRLRMLEIVGRWNEWWSQPEFFAQNAERFTTTTYRTRTGPQARRKSKATKASHTRAAQALHQ